jgi:hypothetical protein
MSGDTRIDKEKYMVSRFDILTPSPELKIHGMNLEGCCFTLELRRTGGCVFSFGWSGNFI